MISADDIEKAKVLLAEDKLEEAMSLLDKLVADKDNELKDEAYYVRGNAFRRGDRFRDPCEAEHLRRQGRAENSAG